MRDKTLFELFKHFSNKKTRTESDCAVVDAVWGVFWNSKDDAVRQEALEWLFARILDKDTNKLARISASHHVYYNRHTLTKKQKKQFRKAIKQLPKKQKKFLVPKKGKRPS